MHQRPSHTFGRRVSSHVAPVPAAGPLGLGEAAERFRSGLTGASRTPQDDFSDWKRRRGAARLAAWLATFALLSPGAVCFVVQAPIGVSAAVEVMGMAANWWLRRRRRMHLAAIRDWEPRDG